MSQLPHPVSRQLFPSPVPVATGWPGDPGRIGAPPAMGPDDVRRQADSARTVADVDAAVSVCRACPRLVTWRESVAVEKRRSFAEQPYWGRPIAGWGAQHPRVLVLGLAPAAHGGNRTGRIFTGDRSGDWLFASLHRVGLATQPTSLHAGDGQELIATRMIAAVRCAPPANKPTPDERRTCAPWLDAELRLVLSSVRAMVCLGAFAWQVAMQALVERGYPIPRPRPRFGHGARLALLPLTAGCDPDRTEMPIGAGVIAPSTRHEELTVLGCFHPSQQNTFTGKLTEPMIDHVLAEAARLAGQTDKTLRSESSRRES